MQRRQPSAKAFISLNKAVMAEGACYPLKRMIAWVSSNAAGCRNTAKLTPFRAAERYGSEREKLDNLGIPYPSCLYGSGRVALDFRWPLHKFPTKWMIPSSSDCMNIGMKGEIVKCGINFLVWLRRNGGTIPWQPPLNLEPWKVVKYLGKHGWKPAKTCLK